PALVRDSLYLVILATSSAGGAKSAAAFSYPLGITSIMNRMAFPSFRLRVGAGANAVLYRSVEPEAPESTRRALAGRRAAGSAGRGGGVERAAAPHPRGVGGAREQVIVHGHHHRNEHHAVVEQMQLEPREPQLHDARGHRGPEQRPAGDDLTLEQRVLDVMPELNHERREPPRAGPAHEARQQRPDAGQHDQGIPVMQHLGVYQPRERLAQDAARLVQRPFQHVHLIGLHQMLGPMRDDDDEERLKGPFVPRASELAEERVSGVRHARAYYAPTRAGTARASRPSGGLYCSAIARSVPLA